MNRGEGGGGVTTTKKELVPRKEEREKCEEKGVPGSHLRVK